MSVAPNKLKSLVLSEYLKLKERRKQAAPKDVALAWISNRQYIDKMVAEKNEWLATHGAVWEPPPTSEEKKVIVMDPVDPIPRFTYYTPVPHNILVDDETCLHNFPYSGTEDNQTNDDKFFKSLLVAYDGRSHENGDDEYLDLSLLVDLVDNLYKILSEGVTFKSFPHQKIFDAISTAFPADGSPDSLRGKYIDMKVGTSSTPKPNIDGLFNKGLQSREETLSSYHELFCRQCLIYDCKVHPKTFPELKPKRKERELIHIEGMCGPYCYKLQFGSSSSVQFVPESSTTLQDTFNYPEWTGSDISLLLSLLPIFSDYCAIAKIMMTKKCNQVYNYIQKDPSLRAYQNKLVVKSPPPLKKKRPMKPFLSKENSKEHAYSPCQHPSDDCSHECSCFVLKNFCEKHCSCRSKCAIRFPGCVCKSNCQTKQCPCYAANRECDVDVCKSCCSDKRDLSKISCQNLKIQLGLKKRVKIAPSSIAGWGAFLKEDVQKNDFIYEYCGEIISQSEADRRGIIYRKMKISYLFNLNEEYVIDATRKGNKMRFSNHSDDPNCYTKVMKVNGDHRIGVYAARDIKAGEELFFNYRYSMGDKLDFDLK